MQLTNDSTLVEDVFTMLLKKHHLDGVRIAVGYDNSLVFPSASVIYLVMLKDKASHWQTRKKVCFRAIEPSAFIKVIRSIDYAGLVDALDKANRNVSSIAKHTSIDTTASYWQMLDKSKELTKIVNKHVMEWLLLATREGVDVYLDHSYGADDVELEMFMKAGTSLEELAISLDLDGEFNNGIQQ